NMALPVLRHLLAEMGAEPQIGDRLALAVEPIQREAAQHDDAAPVFQLVSYLLEQIGGAAQRKMRALDLDQRHAAAPHLGYGGDQLVLLFLGKIIAPARDVAELVRRPAGRVDDRLQGRGRDPLLLAPAAETRHLRLHSPFGPY